MNKKIPTRPLHLTRALDLKECENLLMLSKAYKFQPRTFQGLVDKSFRDCLYHRAPPYFVDIIRDALNIHAFKYFRATSFSLASGDSLIFRYGIGVGFKPHHDEVTEIERERGRLSGEPVIGGDFTTITFINKSNNYSGGELYFPDFDLNLKPEQGDIIMFPATKEFVHGVRAIVQGERVSLLSRFNLTN